MYDTAIIDAAIEQRCAPYFATERPTLQGLCDYLQLIISETQEGEVWEPDDPRMIAIQTCIDAAGPCDWMQSLNDDIETVDVLLAVWGNKALR